MLNKITCESLIFFLAGTQPLNDLAWPNLERPDVNLINSFSRQLAKGIGFTDKQYELAKEKIDNYASVFVDIDLEDAKNTLAIPLREIDRSRWIKIVNELPNNKLYEEHKAPFIAIRFTFQKKLIDSLDEMKRNLGSSEWSYDKIDKIHHVTYSEKNLYKIVNLFKDKNFELSDQVKEIYESLDNLQADNYVPGVYNFEVKNLPNKGLEMITKELGDASLDNLYLYKDRSLRYGLNYFDKELLEQSFTKTNNLTKGIANRSSKSLIVNKEYININNLILSLEQLRRLPVVIVLPSSSCQDALVELHQDIRNIIPAQDVSVMFRMDNNTSDGTYTNQYIRKEKINNTLASNTKIVYTLENKVPKPLLTSNFSPMSIVVYNTNSSIYSMKKVLGCFADLDLVVHYTSKDSKSSNYFYDRDIETINANV